MPHDVLEEIIEQDRIVLTEGLGFAIYDVIRPSAALRRQEMYGHHRETLEETVLRFLLSITNRGDLLLGEELSRGELAQISEADFSRNPSIGVDYRIALVSGNRVVLTEYDDKNGRPVKGWRIKERNTREAEVPYVPGHQQEAMQGKAERLRHLLILAAMVAFFVMFFLFSILVRAQPP